MGRRAGILLLGLILVAGATGYFYWDTVRPYLTPYLGLEDAETTDQTDSLPEVDLPPVADLHRAVLSGSQQRLRRSFGLPPLEPDSFWSWYQSVTGVEGSVEYDVDGRGAGVEAPLERWAGTLFVDRVEPEQWRLGLHIEEPTVFRYRDLELRRSGDSVELLIPALDGVYELPPGAAETVSEWLDRQERVPRLVTEDPQVEEWNDRPVVRLRYEQDGFESGEPDRYRYDLLVSHTEPYEVRGMEVEGQENEWVYRFEYDDDLQRLTSVNWNGPLWLQLPPPLGDAVPEALVGSGAEALLGSDHPLRDLTQDGEYELRFAYTEEDLQFDFELDPLSRLTLATPGGTYRGTPTFGEGRVSGLTWSLDDSPETTLMELNWNWPEEGIRELSLNFSDTDRSRAIFALSDLGWVTSPEPVELAGDDVRRLDEEEVLGELVGSVVNGLAYQADETEPELRDRMDWLLPGVRPFVSENALERYRSWMEDDRDVDRGLPDNLAFERRRAIREQLGLRLPLDSARVVRQLVREGVMLEPEPDEYSLVFQVAEQLPYDLQRRIRVRGPEETGEIVYYNPETGFPYTSAPEGFEPAQENFDEGNFRDARLRLEDLLEEYPESSNINFTLGLIHFEQGEFDQAIPYFQAARDVIHDPQVRYWGNHYLSRIEHRLDETSDRAEAPESDQPAESAGASE